MIELGNSKKICLKYRKMNKVIFDIDNIRMEISFKSFEELRLILSFYHKNNICKINIPCKNNLKKDFLLNSIKIAREEFPNIDLIPHFSILHEFKRNRKNTLDSFIYFLNTVKDLGCNQVLLVSGSQKRSTLNSVSALSFLKDNTLLSNNHFSIGVAFNPYLPSFLFKQEIAKLEKKLESGIVYSIWFQFGTDCMVLEKRIEILKKLISSNERINSKQSKIKLFGSILIPSKQFLARFKYRPWKGVYCSQYFLESVDSASNFINKLLRTYKKYDISPIIETDVSTKEKLNLLKIILQV
tara:strand:- start:406 stop:1299 length:894 start_codon:yes stop_codon:yes gene_type:complete